MKGQRKAEIRQLRQKRTNKAEKGQIRAEIRPEEQSKEVEIFREYLWNIIQ